MFFSFSQFYWFLESCNILKIILNLKNCNKSLVQALWKTFKKLFPKMSLHAQNAVWMQVPHPIFSHGSVYQQRISGGGRGGVWGSSFLSSLHALIRSAPKGASIGPQLWGEVFSTGGNGQKIPILSGLFGTHAARCTFHKLPHGKGITCGFTKSSFITNLAQSSVAELYNLPRCWFQAPKLFYCSGSSPALKFKLFLR